MNTIGFLVISFACLCVFLPATIAVSNSSAHVHLAYPLPLEHYTAIEDQKALEQGRPLTIYERLKSRVVSTPFNLVATAIFFLAIFHTFMTSRFNRFAHHLEKNYQKKIQSTGKTYPVGKEPVSFWATVFHFLGEIEAIFGIWVLPLILSFGLCYSWEDASSYVNSRNFVEPVFVVVIMAIASTRPIVKFAEKSMLSVAKLGGGGVLAWWLSILTIAPLLGSFITEPAAMTIAALLLAKHFYYLSPKTSFCYATLGLLFVNVSVGGTLTHFAAPPILIVADHWDWSTAFTFTNFGWKAVLGIMASNLIYLLIFRKEFRKLEEKSTQVSKKKNDDQESIPNWIVCVHLLFLAWTVFNLHYPALFVIGFLFFVAFTQATKHHQYQFSLRLPVLVGFFLAGLVIHGGLQAWWISPLFSGVKEHTLVLITTILTAFNDNAAITFLASQVPAFNPKEMIDGVLVLKEATALKQAEALQYTVVAAAVASGGLTVIANAPNPAGQSLLSKYFKDGVSPVKLFLGSLTPTLIMIGFFFLL